MGVLKMKEQAAANADTAGYGQLWTKTATPNELWFTDDAGNDKRIVTQMETGTWTPNLMDSSLSTGEGQTYNNRYGQYEKHGKWVTCFCYMDVSSYGSLTTTDPAYVGNLPFTNYNAVIASGNVSYHASTAFNDNEHPIIFIEVNTNYVQIRNNNEDGGIGNMTIADLTTAFIIKFTVTYFLGSF